MESFVKCCSKAIKSGQVSVPSNLPIVAESLAAISALPYDDTKCYEYSRNNERACDIPKQTASMQHMYVQHPIVSMGRGWTVDRLGCQHGGADSTDIGIRTS